MDSDEPRTMVREDPTSEVDLEGGAPIWHIGVSEGVTQGPYTTGELVAMRESGTVQDAMLIWCEGWTDWRPLGEVSEILDAPPLELTAVERPRAKSAKRSTGSFDAPVSMGDDPFASGEAPILSPRVRAADAMQAGQHREGTVEINMNEFRKLSASSPNLPVVAMKMPVTQEDSGLIDMAKVREEHDQRKEEEQAEARIQAQAAPIPIPVPSGLSQLRPGPDFRTKILAGTAVLGMVLAATVAVVALTRTPTPPPTPEPAPTPAVAPPPAAPPSAAKPSATAGAGAEAAAAEAAEPAEGSAGASGAAKTSARRRTGGSRTSAARPSSTPKSSGGGGSIDDLLGRALEGKKSTTKAASTSSSLPDSPSRTAVVSAMNGVKAKVSRCKGDGVATARITAQGSTGRTTDVSVTGVSGAAQSCVERAVKSARFPRFKQSSFTVKFPFKLGG